MEDRDEREPENDQAPASPPAESAEAVTATRRDRPVRLEYAIPDGELWERR